MAQQIDKGLYSAVRNGVFDAFKDKDIRIAPNNEANGEGDRHDAVENQRGGQVEGKRHPNNLSYWGLGNFLDSKVIGMMVPLPLEALAKVNPLEVRNMTLHSQLWHIFKSW